MRNWDFRIIYHFDGTAGNILDILHIHKEGSVGTEKIAVLHQLYDAGCRNVLNFGGSFRVHTPSNDRHQEFKQVMEENGASVKTIEMAWNMMEYDYYCRIMEQYMDIYRDIDLSLIHI